MPLLSVCIPTWNGAEHLDRCLQSVLAQRGVELEVIVADDASTDATVEVARQREDRRVVVCAFEERLGLSGNWNRTWSRARGDYAALVGQDDFVEPDWGQSLVELLEERRDADLAFGRRRFEFADEASRAAIGAFFEDEYPEILRPFYDRLAGTDNVAPSQTMIEEALKHRFEINLVGEPTFVVVRRDAPAARGGFHPEMSQMVDWEFVCRFFVEQPIVHCPRELGVYRLHAKGASVEQAPMSHHYRECDLLHGSVLERFRERLTDEQRAVLEARRAEVRQLQRRHAAAGT